MRYFIFTPFILVLLFISIGVELKADQQTDVIITWHNYSNPLNNDRCVPLKVEYETSKLPSLDKEKRFEVTVTFKLDPIDSLYKAGEHFVIGHNYIAGRVNRADSIESVNRDYTLLDDNNPEAIFTFQIHKNLFDPILNLSFFGGRIINSIRYGIETEFPSRAFITDSSVHCYLEIQLLQESELQKHQNGPILHHSKDNENYFKKK
ncbi:MAG TPA: hypothetical protein PKK33_02220 [Candidatus Cloacimonadota bacterium]|nr:hypothetical protein [Candidatus Cloacimonadota bacterium]